MIATQPLSRREAQARAEQLRAAEFAAEQAREKQFGRRLDRLPETEREQLAIDIFRRYPLAARWWSSGAWRTPHNILRDLMLRELENSNGGSHR